VIVYENVKTNTDLEYVLDGNDVKENIIVKRAGGSYVYRFTLTLTGLTATLLPTGNISLTDSETGEEKYTIPAPYMYDADGVLSYDVHYTLTSAGSGNYTLTVTASDEWINAEDRAFPVTIDPTVTKTTQFMDTYIYSTAPNANYGSISLLPINDDTIVYSMWGLPSLPSGAIITNASLHMMPINLDSGSIYIGAYQMSENWLSSNITWNNAATMTNFGMNTVLLSSNRISKDAEYNAIDVTTVATMWYNNLSTNLGIALKQIAGSNNNVLLYSAEAIAEKRPYFTVTYRLFENGIYFIQNVATGRYMDVEGPSRNEGAIIQQWDFHGAMQSRWSLTHDSNGNIAIRSVYSELCVTSNASSTAVTQTQNSNDSSLWSFCQTSSGYYRIVCTGISSGSNTLGVSSTVSGNGADLVMTTYTDDSNYCDEWNIYLVADYLGVVFDSWNSSSDEIGYFPYSPSIYLEKKDSSATFYFEESMSSAISQWNSVLPISVTETNLPSNADIICYGLNESQYYDMIGDPWPQSFAGNTVYYRTLLGYGIYNNQPIEIYRMDNLIIYLISRGYGESQEKMIATHELGHSLGYKGHSTTATDVMYESVHSNYQLSSSEIAHLLQCYEAFFD